MTKVTWIIVITALIILGGYFLLRGSYQAPELQEPPRVEVPAPGQESVLERVVEPGGAEEPLPSEEPALSAKEVNMASGNFFFSPKALALAKGQPVKIIFQNSGSHTFTIDELGVNEPLRGSTVAVEFTPNESGSFEYYCAVPGHRERGMFGSLEVE